LRLLSAFHSFPKAESAARFSMQAFGKLPLQRASVAPTELPESWRCDTARYAMPRRSTMFVQGKYYHIYNRGARRVSIFREARNYVYVTRLMQQVARQSQLTILVYCLLPNHYHWLIRQDGDTPAGVLPRRVFGSYSQAYNHAYAESGTLFQGTYSVRHIDSDAYLRHICRYIHINPVKHGIAAGINAWPYSNYLEWLDQRSETPVDRQFICTFFETPQQYALFVGEYLSGRAELPEELRRFENDLEL
jgi:REP element-mobilizing transposase RayT